MGRKLYRVTLDFSWPMNKVWEGYINPHWKPCPEEDVACFNGWTAAGKWLDALTRLMSLMAEDCLRGETEDKRTPHPFITSWGEAPRYGVSNAEERRLRQYDKSERWRRWREVANSDKANQVLPLTPELRLLLENLAGEEVGVWSGSRVAWGIASKLKKTAKVKKSWGTCQVCKGSATDPAVKKVYNRWKPKEPPEGPGYQLWETTSEGSPVSPVFETLDALCEWCADNATTFGSEKASKDEWRQMLDEDFVRHTVTDGKTTMVFM